MYTKYIQYIGIYFFKSKIMTKQNEKNNENEFKLLIKPVIVS